MFTAYLCVLIAAVLPYIWVGYAKFSGGGYDNKSPREFLDKAQGKVKRAHWAQLNSFEVFPAFAAAVIIAHLCHVQSGLISNLAVSFVIFRVIYGFCYILDQSSWRSFMWFGGFACVVSLYILSLYAISTPLIAN